MVLLIIFTLVGMALGEAIFYGNGWVIGGVLGFLITKIFQLSNKIQRLENVVDLLKKQDQPLSTKIQSNQPVPVAAPPETKAEEARVPLAERLKSHGIDLPPEVSTTDVVSGIHNDAAAASPEMDKPRDTIPTSKPVHQQPRVYPPRTPNAVEKAFHYVQRFFTEGNPIVRIGMVVMFFGLSFLVKYASNQGLLPIEVRMSAVAAIAIGLIAVGWKTRSRAGGFGLVLQGGGIAALYLTVFAAAKMYSLMPTGAAFGIMFIIVLLGAALAVLQNAQVLALIATAGGFLAPILTSDGSGNHVGLFSYYLLLNIGILAIAWFKTWRMLNWVGFVFTFVITSVWGLLKYQPHLYASTQPFLLAFFALYLVVSILFSLKQPPNLKGLVDGSLVFGLPIVGFGLQTALLKHTEYGLAISALVLATTYVGLAKFLWGKYQQTHRVLIESFIALAVCFATLSIPLALDAQWTSATWALEATGLIWVGLRQSRLLPRIAGYLLHLAGAFSLFINGPDTGTTPIVSGDFIGMVILSASALCIAYLINRYQEHAYKFEHILSTIARVIGWIWWFAAGYMEITHHMSGENYFASLIGFYSLSVAAFLWFGVKVQWQPMGQVGYWLLPLTALWALRDFGESLFMGYAAYPSQGWNLLALALFVAVQYRFLWSLSKQGVSGLQSLYHVLGAWFLFSLGYWEALHWQNHFNWLGTSAAVLWFACLVIPLVALLYVTNKPIWPFAQHSADYKNLIPAPLLLLLIGWFLFASTYSGITDQFYLPILNPLDLAQVAVLIICAYAIKRGFMGLANAPKEFRYGSLGVLGFIWLNTVLLRALHQYADVTYAADILWDSVVVQMSLSILWAICALVVMNISRRTQVRELWIIGAGLLGLVLLKLFTKDLTGTGTLARIISFMVVGGLMLLIGYLSPIPAKVKSSQEETV